MTRFLQSPVLWACLAGFALTLMVFYPGFMNYDAGSQLEQARLNEFSDLYPPFMAWLWGRMDTLFPGPFPMLLLQSALFWGGVGLLFAGGRRWWVALVLLGIGLFPVVWAGVGTLQKDTLMTGMLLVMAGLLMTSRRTGQPLWAWLALLPCFIAIATRHNAAAAAPPLLLWWGWEVLRHRPRWAMVGAAVAATVLLYLSASAVNERLTTYFLYPTQQILLHDLIGISLDQEQVILPEYASLYADDPTWLPYTLEDLRTMYSVGYAARILVAQPPQVKTILYITQEDFYAMLTGTWRNAVTRYPVSYAVHRAKNFLVTVGVTPGNVCAPYSFEFSGYDNPTIGVSYTPNAAFQALLPLWTFFQTSWFFRAFLYLAAAAGLFGWAWRSRPRQQVPIMALTGSAMLYVAPLLFISITCEFRMNYWSVVATLVAAGLAVIYRGREIE